MTRVVHSRSELLSTTSPGFLPSMSGPKEAADTIQEREQGTGRGYVHRISFIVGRTGHHQLLRKLHKGDTCRVPWVSETVQRRARDGDGSCARRHSKPEKHAMGSGMDVVVGHADVCSPLVETD